VELPTKAMYDEFKNRWENTPQAKEMLFDDEETRVWLVW